MLQNIEWSRRIDSFKSGKEQTQHKCPFCGKAILRRSIPRHCREKHTEEIVNAATCVDDIKLVLMILGNISCSKIYPWRGGVSMSRKKDL